MPKFSEWQGVIAGGIVMVIVTFGVLAFNGPQWAAFGFSIVAYLIVAARR